jgi:cytidylate kinase
VDLVFLHGPAASGKLTIARALEARVGFPVFQTTSSSTC